MLSQWFQVDFIEHSRRGPEVVNYCLQPIPVSLILKIVREVSGEYGFRQQRERNLLADMFLKAYF